MGAMRRLPALVLIALLACLLSVTVAPATGATVHQTDPQPATDPDGDGSTDDAPLPGGDIIPQPNSGQEPEDAGDRGGVLQGVVFVAILAGLGTIGGLAVRESRRARRRDQPSGA